MSNKSIKREKHRMDTFSARDSNCPICGKVFRSGCDHSVRQAKYKLFENYIKAIVRNQ